MGPRTDPYRLCDSCFNFWKSLWALLSWFYGSFSPHYPWPLWLLWSSSWISAAFPELHLMFGTGFPYMPPSAVRESLFDNNWARYRRMSISLGIISLFFVVFICLFVYLCQSYLVILFVYELSNFWILPNEAVSHLCPLLWLGPQVRSVIVLPLTKALSHYCPIIAGR